ncbi:VOC family protein [Nocardioides sp.]|uniref:VOC family protein n=1 Tax=Nocardioides sp. TaxID=35761 RepID=UPI0027328890|nr:VOC family protein [Nocardioides sp.]MDP3894859.1 VOC family protein [Nocardioides sp.]
MTASEPELVVSLPIDDRRRSAVFYREFLGAEPEGPLADDGLPEPLQFRLDTHTTLMLIPRGGFDWVLGDREAAPPGTSECLLSRSVADERLVDVAMEHVRHGGGDVVTEPAHQSWGYTATCADPDGHLWQVLGVPPRGSTG